MWGGNDHIPFLVISRVPNTVRSSRPILTT